MISDETFDELRADWDYSGGATGSYWHMLKHAEVNRFDLSAMKSSIHSNLKCYFADSVYRFNDEEERELMLDLRDRMRAECLLPPLAIEERRNWSWSDVAPTRTYCQVPFAFNSQMQTSPDQNRAIVSYLAQHYPEAIRYLKSVWKHNGAIPCYKGGPYDKYIVRQQWSCPFVQDAACAILGETNVYSLRTADIDQQAVVWPD